MDSQSISMLSTKLYPNNFVLVMTPYKALIFSFFGVFLSMCIITLLRDLFMEFVQNIIVANIMTITYIVANFVLFAFPLKNLVGTIFAYISLYNVSMIWCHKFSSVALSAIPLNMGLLSGFMFISAIIVFRLIFSRRMVIAND
ncbi:hypothetical protein [Clostridium manihotivorum]|nr:hypothetical protein [Clostridium manihotivorum]